MNKNLKWLFLIPFSLVLLVISIISIGYSSWIITGSSTIASNEITGLSDESLEDLDFKNSVVYTGSSRSPHESIQDFDATQYEITYSTSTSQSTSAPTKVGTYAVEYYNTVNHIITKQSFEITKNQPYVEIGSLPSYFYSTSYTFDNSLFYVYDQFDNRITNFKMDFTIGEVNSSKEGGTINSQEQTIQYVCTVWDNFSNSASGNYFTVEGTFKITLKSVAYIDSSYYSRIETALAAAKATTGNQVVTVIPGLTVSVFENCEISSGDTLMITFQAGADVPTNVYHTNQGFLGYARDKTSATTIVNVLAGVQIKNSGSLIVNGEVTGGSGGSISSYTYGRYAQVNLLSNSIINSTSGSSITCYGYIFGKDASINQIILDNRARLTVPYIVDEHRGGTMFANMADWNVYNPAFKTSPFNRFHFNNIDGNLRINYGGVVIGRVNLYANEQDNITTINTIGPSGSTNYMLSLDSGSYIDINYTHNINAADSKMKINIYGSGKLNSLSLSLKIPIFGQLNLTTQGLLFPISHYYDITLNPIGSQPAEFDMTGQDIKILPGAKLTINKNVSVNAKTIAAYTGGDNFHDIVATQQYPTGLDNGKIILNGTLNAVNIGGRIYSTDSSLEAKLIISGSTTVNTQELTLTNGEEDYYTINSPLKLATYTNETYAMTDISEAGVYGLVSNYYASEKTYCWERYTNYSRYTISFVLPDGCTNLGAGYKYVYAIPEGSPYEITSAILPDNSQFKYPGYQLVGWYLDPDFTIPAIKIDDESENALITGDTPLYPKWEYRDYDIYYAYYQIDENGNKVLYTGAEGLVVNENNNTTSKFSSNLSTEIPLYSIKASLNAVDLVFSGWYMDIGDGKVIQISSITPNIVKQYEDVLNTADGLYIYCILEESKYHLVSYQDIDGNLLHSEIVKDGDSHQLIDHSSYTFEEYFDSSTGRGNGAHYVFNNSWDKGTAGSNVNITADTIIKPSYIKKSYYIELNNNLKLLDASENTISQYSTNKYEVYLGEKIKIRNSSRTAYTFNMENTGNIQIEAAGWFFVTIPSITDEIEVTGNGKIV